MTDSNLVRVLGTQTSRRVGLLPYSVVAQGNAAISATIDWAKRQLGEQPVLIYSSAAPEKVAVAQAELGREQAAQLVEDAMRRIARALSIGPEIAPGVPWTLAADGTAYALALKSGNFGGVDFFVRAFEVSP